MRKVFSLIMVITLLFSGQIAFAEGSFSVEAFTGNSDLYHYSADPDRNLTFIMSNTARSDLIFHHPFEIDDRYSSIQNEVLAINYLSPDRYPVFRTWVFFETKTPMNIDSISLEFVGSTFLFRDVGDESRVIKKDQGYEEQLLIVFGKSSYDVFSVLMQGSLSYITNRDSYEHPPTVKMILHGDEDIEFVIPEGFYYDFALLSIQFSFNNGEWLKYIKEFEGTPCEAV